MVPGLRSLIRVMVLAVILVGGAPQPGQTRTLDLAFMPPEVEPQDMCTAATDPIVPEDAGVDGGVQDNTLKWLQYLRRDILRLQSREADRWFDFLMTLINWQSKLDPAFGYNETLMAQISLHVDAGRIDALEQAGLIGKLRESSVNLNYAQKVGLAQYYLNGIGVARDEDFARSLIRDAAYGGNVDALMSLARMELQGNPLAGWDAPLDLTVTLAFGGMLGQMDAGTCNRAERIAREYLYGDVVTPNPEVAYAWYKFAADLGGADAAWRIVEIQLDATAVRHDNAEMLKYLKLAVARGITLDAGQAAQITSAGQVDEATLRGILGFNYNADAGRGRPSVSPYFQLTVNIDGQEAPLDGPYLEYLRELTRFDTAPGWVFTQLANETLVRKGRWAGEAEARALLEQAASRRDPEGMQMLAQMLIRQRDDPAALNRAVNLLGEAATRFGLMPAMSDLDALFRCQAPDAPRLAEADLWAANYRATLDETVTISPTDLIALDPYKQPETLAQIQTQALAARPASLAAYLERAQLDPYATQQAHRIWATRTNASDKALEVFADLEFSLATNPAERNLALELFRRVYLNNGVTTALDLAVALTDDNARNPGIAAEIERLLTKAGNRGEGAAIRLKARLMARTRSAQSVYQEFAAVIEERGDFLALMFAIPFVDRDLAEDYIDRAVSLMHCGTKDADELGDAYAIRLMPELSDQWRRIGLEVAGGHVLAKLDLADRQSGSYDKGAAPSEADVLARDLAEGDRGALRSLFALTMNPDLPTYDPNAAADHLAALLRTGSAQDEAWVLGNFRKAGPDVRALIAQRIDINGLYLLAAQRGDVAARYDYALLLRETAESLTDLQSAVRWLQEAADGGNVEAMADLGEMMAFGLGSTQDRKAALGWLEQADRAGVARAAGLARMLRLDKTP